MRRPWAPTDGRGAEGPGGCEPSDCPDVPGDRVTAQPQRTPSHGKATPDAGQESAHASSCCVPRAPVESVLPTRCLNRILYFHKHSECDLLVVLGLRDGSAGTGGRFGGRIERGKSVNFDLEEQREQLCSEQSCPGAPTVEWPPPPGFVTGLDVDWCHLLLSELGASRFLFVITCTYQLRRIMTFDMRFCHTGTLFKTEFCVPPDTIWQRECTSDHTRDLGTSVSDPRNTKKSVLTKGAL